MIDPSENSIVPSQNEPVPAADPAGQSRQPEKDRSAEIDLSPERVAMQHLGGRIRKNLTSKRPVKPLQDDASVAGSAEENREHELSDAYGGVIRIEKSSERMVSLPAAIKNVVDNPNFHTDVLINSALFQSKRPFVLGITSAIAGEGKTTVALRLAMDIARSGAGDIRNVCLVDMSLGEDTLSHPLAIDTDSGLVHVLEETDRTLTVIEMAGCENLSILPAGKSPDYAARVARSPMVPEVLNTGKTIFDVLVVDLPAISTKNVLPITQHLDAIVLVVRAGVTPNETVTSALEQMDQSKVLGIVLNRVGGRMTP